MKLSLFIGLLTLVVGYQAYTIDGRISGPVTASEEVDPSCVEMVEEGSCEFYECFFRRYKCYDFLLADAKNICMKLKDRVDRLTEPGKQWVRENEICTQNALLPNYTSNEPLDCVAFRTYGLNQHRMCSVEKGVCNIFWDNKFTLAGVLDWNNLKHIGHTIRVLSDCSRPYFVTMIQSLQRMKHMFTGGS